MSQGARWADEFENLTVGLVRDRDPAWVAAKSLGPNLVELASASAAREWEIEGYETQDPYAVEDHTRTFVAIIPLAGWTALIADFSVVWTDDEVVRDLSTDGEYLYYSWGTGALHLLQVARDGEIVRAFDPWDPDDDPVGDPLSEESAIDWRPDTFAPGVLLLERLCGVTLDPSLQDRPDARFFGYTF